MSPDHPNLAGSRELLKFHEKVWVVGEEQSIQIKGFSIRKYVESLIPAASWQARHTSMLNLFFTRAPS